MVVPRYPNSDPPSAPFVQNSFQKNVLDERLTEIGYETIMSGGLSLNRSLLEHSPQYSNLPDYEKARYLDQISCEHTFAFQK